MLQHGTRAKIAERAAPHLPFEEFKAESLEGLLKLLEKYKVASSKIQFSESESAHSFCCHTWGSAAGEVQCLRTRPCSFDCVASPRSKQSSLPLRDCVLRRVISCICRHIFLPFSAFLFRSHRITVGDGVSGLA